LLSGGRLRRPPPERGAGHTAAWLGQPALLSVAGVARCGAGQRAILAGDDITGASTFQIDAGLDTGPIFGVVTEPIRPRDTAGDLLARLAESGAGLLAATMDAIADGTAMARPQSGDGVSLAAKITVDDARVDWSTPSRYVDRQVRACTPAPGAWTTFRGQRLKLGPISAPTVRCGRSRTMVHGSPAPCRSGPKGSRSTLRPVRSGSLGTAGRASIDVGDGLGKGCAASARRATWRRLIRPVEWPTTCFALSIWTARTPICCYLNC
jgi:hypothetical protein